jgi:lipopolysaccharide biosynthesis glycosyltransferase
MIVACAIDRTFAPLAGVMLASLFDKGEVGNWRVVVFGYRLRARDKAKLRASCDAHQERLEFIDVDPSSPFLRNLIPTHFALSPAPYLRLLIPALLAGEGGRLLYLDADTLVLAPLRPLAELDLGDCMLAAVEDHESAHPSTDGRLSFPADRPYFNSGVLLIDLDRWRSRDLTKRGFQFIEENEDRLVYPDQDVLNCIVENRWKALDARWNMTRQRAEAGYANAGIVHFTGTKPWSSACRHPARSLFLHYKAFTPWRDARLKTDFETRLRRSIAKRRRRLRLFSDRFTRILSARNW